VSRHPEEVVHFDQKINVVILDFDDEKKRIALGLKQLTPHPWDALDPNLKVGDKIKGKVVVMADYGAFVEIAPGVEGLSTFQRNVLVTAPAQRSGLHEGWRRG
jgi:small subunit ribosomal protein S1